MNEHNDGMINAICKQIKESFPNVLEQVKADPPDFLKQVEDAETRERLTAVVAVGAILSHLTDQTEFSVRAAMHLLRVAKAKQNAPDFSMN